MNVDATSILGEPCGFEMIITFTSPYTSQYLFLLVLLLRWNQSHNRGSDHLIGRVAEDAFRIFVPAGDDAVEILPDYCIVRIVHDCRQATREQI